MGGWECVGIGGGWECVGIGGGWECVGIGGWVGVCRWVGGSV